MPRQRNSVTKLRGLLVACLLTFIALSGAKAQNSTDQTPVSPVPVQQSPFDEVVGLASTDDLSPCGSQQGLRDDSSTKPLQLANETRYVIDEAGALTQECAADLSHRLAVLEQEKGAQMRVLIVSSLNGDDVESYASNAFHTWRLGRKGIDDGVLFVAAINEHRDRIEVGYGLEGAIPDGLAGDVLRDNVEPHFKAEEYNAGVSEAMKALEYRIRTEPLVAPHPHHSAGAKLAFFSLTMVLCIVAGGLGAAKRWNWGVRVSVPLGIALVMEMFAAKLYLVGGYFQAVILTAVLVALSGLGVLIVTKSKAFKDWLGCCVLVGFVLSLLWLLVALKLNFSASDWGTSFLAVIIGSALFGSLAYLFTSNMKSAGQPSRRGTGWRPNRSSSAWSSSGSSSSSWSSSSSSGSSSSDSGSSGGGGDSGGGGASGSW